MADISKINPNGTEYNLKDATARAGIESSKTVTGNPITVPDAAPINAEDITVDITPQQDLHGYDRPWAGGGWKNKLKPLNYNNIKNGVTITALKDSDDNLLGYDLDGTATADMDLWGTFDEMSLNAGVSRYITTGLTSAITGLQLVFAPEYFGVKTSIVSNSSITGAYINIKNGTVLNHVKIYPMVCLNSETDPTFAPYSNICPIEGRTGAKLDRVGKNWFTTDENDYEVGTIDPSTGALLNDSSYKRTKEYLPIRKGSYKLTGIYNFRIFVYDSSKNYLGYGDGASIMTISNPNVRFYKARWSASNDMSTAMLRLASITDSTYEPYQGQQYTASFGETVHGGKWHVTKGGTDKTHGYVEFDGSDDEGWTAESVGWSNWDYLFYTNADVLPPRTNRDDDHIYVKSNIYKGTSTNGIRYHATGNDIAIVGYNSAKIEVAVDKSMTVSEFKAFLAQNPLQVCYELETPTAISTPKQNVPMLQGINTVSADCGDTSLKYQPDNVIGELKGDIEDVIDYAEPKFVNYSSYPHDTDPETAFGVNVRLRRDRGYVSIENVALTFWQNYPIADFYYEIQNPVPTEFIPEYDVEKLFLHINGQSFLNVILTNTGILKLRMYSPVRIVDNYPNVFWLQSADETGCKDAKY